MSHPTQLSALATPLQWALGLAIGLSCMGTAFAQLQQDGSGSTGGSGSGTAAEPKDPYYIGAGIGFTHDSNVLRQSNNDTSDYWTSLSLLGGLNKNLGRQRLYLDGTVSNNRYNEYKSLDNTSYGLNTGVDWETVNNLSGNVRYGVTQDLANRALAGVPATTSKNSQKTQLAGATARYGMTSRVALEGGLQYRSVDYSLAQYASLENTQKIANAGVVYGLTGLLTLGVGVRGTKTDTPRYSPAGGDEADRRDVDFTVNWSPSGLSTISARLSLSDEDHTRATALNFNGVTGQVGWDYRPTGRLRFNTLFSRDTGTEARFIDFTGGDTTVGTESYRLTTTLQAGVTYALTGKIDTSLVASRARGSLVSSNVSSGTDTLTTVGLGATYKATRSLLVSCKVGRETRSTNSTFSSPYQSNTVGCLANFTLR
ncbi:MAG: hypothetical protein V4739_03915 [Pseudomonadota bacterium]